jgi:DNA-binding IscR family transcriptional regulator
MKLTRRQEDVIRKMLDLHDLHQAPIHYKTLADHLGVSPFTAYDMLRLLEEKGLVTSEYQLASDKSGPGRGAALAPRSKRWARNAAIAKWICS